MKIKQIKKKNYKRNFITPADLVCKMGLTKMKSTCSDSIIMTDIDKNAAINL